MTASTFFSYSSNLPRWSSAGGLQIAQFSLLRPVSDSEQHRLMCRRRPCQAQTCLCRSAVPKSDLTSELSSELRRPFGSPPSRHIFDFSSVSWSGVRNVGVSPYKLPIISWHSQKASELFQVGRSRPFFHKLDFCWISRNAFSRHNMSKKCDLFPHQTTLAGLQLQVHVFQSLQHHL